MATGTVQTPNVVLKSIEHMEFIYNPNYGEIIGIEIYTTTSDRFSIYFNKQYSSLEFYKNGSIVWSK